MDFGDIGAWTGLIGGLAGLISLGITWKTHSRESSTRERKESEDRMYEIWVSLIESDLRSMAGQAIIRIDSKFSKWAARAVDEKRLEWKSGGTSIGLPSR